MADKKWYVLRTAGTKEKKAAEYLVKEIERHPDLQAIVDQVLVPVKKEIVTKNGKRKEVERLLFPGYVLIHAELNPDLEYVIRNGIPGMSGFLTEKTGNGQDRIPVPIRDEEAQRILGVQDENAVSAAETEVNFTVGESVRITDGPFSGFDGTVEEILQDRSKLKVVVVIFGRKTLLGSKGLNIMDFCKQFNARTQDQAGKVLPVVITVFSDKSFSFEVKQPPVAVSLKEAAKISKASGEPNRKKVATVTWDQVKEIAQSKMPDLNAFTLRSAMSMVAGTARSMGIKVEGQFPENI